MNILVAYAYWRWRGLTVALPLLPISGIAIADAVCEGGIGDVDMLAHSKH